MVPLPKLTVSPAPPPQGDAPRLMPTKEDLLAQPKKDLPVLPKKEAPALPPKTEAPALPPKGDRLSLRMDKPIVVPEVTRPHSQRFDSSPITSFGNDPFASPAEAFAPTKAPALPPKVPPKNEESKAPELPMKLPLQPTKVGSTSKPLPSVPPKETPPSSHSIEHDPFQVCLKIW